MSVGDASSGEVQPAPLVTLQCCVCLPLSASVCLSVCLSVCVSHSHSHLPSDVTQGAHHCACVYYLCVWSVMSQIVGVGSYVTRVVTDASSNTVHYRLVTPGFSIDRHSGVITTATALSPSTTYTVSRPVITVASLRYECVQCYRSC